MNELEHIGRLYMETQRLLGEYGRLLDLLSRSLTDQGLRDTILVDAKTQSWSIVLDMSKPPATAEG